MLAQVDKATLAWARGAFWAVEQPVSSLLYLHPRVVELRKLGASLIILGSAAADLQTIMASSLGSGTLTWSYCDAGEDTPAPSQKINFWMGLHGARSPKRSYVIGNAH